MLKRILLLIVCLFSLYKVSACINVYRTLLSGEVVHHKATHGKVFTRAVDTVELRNKANLYYRSYEESGSIKSLSDFAAALIYLGEYKKAKSIYEQIELESPHLYSTASNLGTIYELIGQPDSALVWIRKSLELNPDSHFGSEWIHIKILEFKLSPSNISTSSILGLDFGEDELPENINAYNLSMLINHIKHQLRERVVFVKPENKIVGNIYFDYGNVLALDRDLEAALESYEEAKEFGFTSDLMDIRIKAINNIIVHARPNKLLGEIKDYVREHLMSTLIMILIVIISILFFIIRLIYSRHSIKRNRS